MTRWQGATTIIHQLAHMHVSQSTPWDERVFRRGAPYKALMMLAVSDGVRAEVFGDVAIIPLNDWLQQRYRQYVERCGDPVRNEPRMPFVHLQHEPFWRLMPQKPYTEVLEQWDLRSEEAFRQHVVGAELDALLLAMMRDPRWHAVVRYVIVRAYFAAELAEVLWDMQ
jgi:predicted restriction endonuclease